MGMVRVILDLEILWQWDAVFPSMYCPEIVRIRWVWIVWFAHPGGILGWSEYFGSFGQLWYNPYSILKISMLFDSVTGHPSELTSSSQRCVSVPSQCVHRKSRVLNLNLMLFWLICRLKGMISWLQSDLCNEYSFLKFRIMISKSTYHVLLYAVVCPTTWITESSVICIKQYILHNRVLSFLLLCT